MSQQPGSAATPVFLVFAAFAFSVLACANPDGGSAEADDSRSRIRIVVATHGQSGDPFWSIVANGAHAAARDLGVRLEYQSPPRFDMVAMSNLIEAATASMPTGLVVSIPDGDALGSSIRAATGSGLPVVSINSGDGVYRDLGVLLHVGQPEFEAGLAAGQRMATEGVRAALCINHEVGNASLDLRCEGFSAGLEEVGGVVSVLAIDLANPDDAQQRVGNALVVRPETDGILTLGPAGAGPTLAALRASGRLDALSFATFDLSPGVIDAVLDGSMLFAIDQQPFLQGYLAVTSLVTYLETLALPGGGEVLKTGPGFVTRENAARVRALTEVGIR